MPDSNGKPYWWEVSGQDDPAKANGGLGKFDSKQFADKVWSETKNFWSDINGNRVQNPNAGTIGNAGLGQASQDMTNQNQIRGMQMSLIQQLQDQAAGRGPSLAQMQLQQGTDRNISQAMALGQSQRGAGAQGMLKGIQGQQAGIAQGMAGDAAILRLQEQMAAQNALGQQLGGTRGQDAQTAQWTGGMQNEQFGRQAAAAQAQAKLELEREKMLNEQARKDSPLGFFGGLLSSLSSLSDERLKTDIKPGESKLYAFLDKLGSHEYKYKDPKHGSPRISPMAQELEKSELGKEFVFEAGPGKAVDYGKGLGTMLASQAALHKRLKALEGK